MMASAPTPPMIAAKHHGSDTNLPVNRIVMHATVSPCEHGGARNIARYFQNPSYVSSCHYVVDPGEVVQCVNDWTVAYHAPPNEHSIGVELCDPQSGSDSRWDDALHQQMLDRAAALVRQLCEAYGVPMVWLMPDELAAGARGITDHENVGVAWSQTTHVDPQWTTARSEDFMRRVHAADSGTAATGGNDVSYEETRRAVVDVLWGDKHPSRVEGSDVTISLGGAIMNSDRADYLTLQLVRGYQAAFDRLADAVGQVQPVAPEDLKQAVRTAMAETVQVEVSVRDADA